MQLRNNPRLCYASLWNVSSWDCSFTACGNCRTTTTGSVSCRLTDCRSNRITEALASSHSPQSLRLSILNSKFSILNFFPRSVLCCSAALLLYALLLYALNSQFSILNSQFSISSLALLLCCSVALPLCRSAALLLCTLLLHALNSQFSISPLALLLCRSVLYTLLLYTLNSHFSFLISHFSFLNSQFSISPCALRSAAICSQFSFLISQFSISPFALLLCALLLCCSATLMLCALLLYALNKFPPLADI